MRTVGEGFTTGSCAAAAALACCLWQRDGVCPEQVSVVVPEGRIYAPEIVPHADGRTLLLEYAPGRGVRWQDAEAPEKACASSGPIWTPGG